MLDRAFSKIRIPPLVFYQGTALLMQLVFFRAVSIELGLDTLADLAQLFAIGLVAAAIIRFGCENAIGRVLLASGADESQRRSLGFEYVIAALARSGPFALAHFALGYVLFGMSVELVALSVLLAINLSCSFLERALGQYAAMIALDYKSSFAILVFAYYILGYMPQTGTEIVMALAVLEGAKLFCYLAAMARHLRWGDSALGYTSFKLRAGYAASELLSIVSNFGFQIFLPIVIGPTASGAFFLLQRLANPLTFVLNVANSLATARMVKESRNIRGIYWSSVRILALVAAGLGLAALAASPMLLALFNLEGYRFEFALILAGVITNLLTGASAPVFNNLGRPFLNLSPSLLFIIAFVAICAVFYVGNLLDLEAAAWAFFIASAIKNGAILIGLLHLQRSRVI